MGDIHGGLLAMELKEIAGELQLQGVGGKFMRECGVAMMQGQVSTDLVSSIGLVEALPHLLRGMKAMKQARRYIKQEMPSVIVMIDYPGFNLPLLKWIRRKRLQGRFSGSKVVYYIPPNEWLFLEGSASSVCSLSNLVLSVYPDEFEHYRKSAAKGMKDGVVADENGQTKVQYVGHPLVDYVDRSKMSKSQAREIIRREQSTSSSSPQSRKSPAVIINEDSLVIALLPASRKQELSLVLPIMLEACSILADTLQQQQQQQRERCESDVVFVVSVAREEFAEAIHEESLRLKLDNRVVLFGGSSHVAIQAADVCISKSGSCSLEVGLLNVPQVVVYKVGKATAFVLRRILRFKLKYVSLVNLILGRMSVPELIQKEAVPEKISKEVANLLSVQQQPASTTAGLAGKKKLSRKGLEQLESYQELRAMLGSGGAVRRAAERVLAILGT